MQDSLGHTLTEGDAVKFFPDGFTYRCPECGNRTKLGVPASEVMCTKSGNHKSHGHVRMARVSRLGVVQQDGTVLLEGDPFPVAVQPERLELDTSSVARKGAKAMATASSARPSSVKELRAKAKKIGVDGWEQMSIAELEAAVSSSESPAPKAAGSKPKAATPAPAKAKKGTTAPKSSPKTETKKTEKPAPAKKTTAAKKSSAPKKAPKVTGPNPYREGTLRHKIAEELLKGGTLAELRKRIGKGVQITNRDGELLAGDELKAELSHRIMATSYDIRNITGATRKKEGRGDEAFWQIIPKK